MDQLKQIICGLIGLVLGWMLCSWHTQHEIDRKIEAKQRIVDNSLNEAIFDAKILNIINQVSEEK